MNIYLKNGKLNMNTSEKCAHLRSCSFSPKLLFSSEKSRNVEKSLFNFILEVPTSCSGKSTFITKRFESNSEVISSRFEIPNECISKDISVNKFEEPSNIISAGKYDYNCR